MGLGDGEKNNALLQGKIIKNRIVYTEAIPAAVKRGERHMRVYLSGPMSRHPNFNFDAFREAAEWLRPQGYSVFNPAEQGYGDGDPDTGTVSDGDYQKFLREDIAAITRSDMIVMLEGWEQSKGARFEFDVARKLGLEIRHLIWGNDGRAVLVPHVRPERHPNSQRFHDLLEKLGELHDRKQADYGRGDDPFANVRASEEWGIQGWVGAMIRLNDKVRRLQSLRTKGSLANEAAVDSFMDIAVYSLIALCLYEQQG